MRDMHRRRSRDTCCVMPRIMLNKPRADSSRQTALLGVEANRFVKPIFAALAAALLATLRAVARLEHRVAVRAVVRAGRRRAVKRKRQL
ncbi:hypothetical protein BN2476_1240001 [Paraburkholderia piptadeniae]|uniref:Uncharacterized protein n=1 Tax=Paraburkholderia piptadeniae TaxID=1701573 RepID=A0A1N7SVV1_9BURK|nr:hypothetical protein BN2476_1240001 [Paraburkholderia piptadeniae]